MSNHIELDSVFRDRQVYSNPCDYGVTAEQVATWIANPREVRALPQNPGERPLDYVSSLDLINAVLPYPRIELFATNLVLLDNISGGNTLNILEGSTTIAPAINDVLMTSSAGYAASNGIQRNVEYHVVNVVVAPPYYSVEVSLTQGGPVQTFTNGTGLDLLLADITPAQYDTVIGLNDDAATLINYPRVYIDVHSDLYKDIRRINAIGGTISDAKFILVQDRVQFDQNLTPVWIHYKSHGEQVMRFKRNYPLHIRFLTRTGDTIEFFSESNLTIPTNPYKQSIVTIIETPYIRDATYSNHSSNPATT
jgi:hypothetical protein